MADHPPEFDAARFLLKLVAGVIVFRLVGLSLTGGMCVWWYRNAPPPSATKPISPVCDAVTERADAIMSSTFEIALALLGGGSAALSLQRRRPPEDPPP